MQGDLYFASSAWSKVTRTLLGALVLVWASAAAAQGPPREAPTWKAAANPPQTLSLQDLQEAQRTLAALELQGIEWPRQNTAPRPTLEEYLPEEALIRRAEDPLRMSAALEALYSDPVTAEQLQAEMEREAVSTKQPDRLRELWRLLGNDPYLFAEVIARPILAENRLRARYYADEKIHGALRAKALAELSGLGEANQLQTLSGSYNEVEYRLLPEGETNYDDREDLDQGIQRRNPEQWKQVLASLGDFFGRENVTDPSRLVGTVSGLREDTEFLYARAVVRADSDRIRVGTISWAKTPFGAWWERSRDGFAADGMPLNPEGRAVYSPPPISPAGFTNGEGWRAFSTTGAPTGRTRFVWQHVGSSLIIAWGGENVYGAYFNSGGRYNLTTDSWSATSTGTNCPAAQPADAWAWTGTQLIIWNGGTQSGARYNLASNDWSTMTSTNNPGVRINYTMVWSGTEAILWGGVDGVGAYVNTGGKYNPTTNTWTATATGANLPAGRSHHTATWDVARNYMHVWGGYAGSCLNSGGVYNGASNWYSLSAGAPPARWRHGQVPYYFNGFMVWGGDDSFNNCLNTGGWYDGDTSGSWHTITTIGAPTARRYFASIFGYNGRQMIIWGGEDLDHHVVNTGGRYIPQFDSWVALTTQDAPEARYYTKGVDFADEGLAMAVWGGNNMGAASTSDLNTGAVYIFTEG